MKEIAVTEEMIQAGKNAMTRSVVFDSRESWGRLEDQLLSDIFHSMLSKSRAKVILDEVGEVGLKPSKS